MLNLSLSTALFGMAAASVWLAYIATWIEFNRLTAQVVPLREAARGLRLSKPDRLSAYRILNRNDEYAMWHLEVPPQPPYELRLATRGIGPDGTAEHFKSTPLSPGTHTLEIRHSGSMGGANATAILDRYASRFRNVTEAVVKVDETFDWYPQAGFTADRDTGVAEDHPPEQPLVLHRVRFHEPGTAEPPDGPANGVLLWIQPL